MCGRKEGRSRGVEMERQRRMRPEDRRRAIGGEWPDDRIADSGCLAAVGHRTDDQIGGEDPPHPHRDRLGRHFGQPRKPSLPHLLEAAGLVEAICRWHRMAGGVGELLTGHCLLGGSGQIGAAGRQLETVTTRVHFAPLSAAEIEASVATGEPLACAGGFALEGRGGLVVERLEGCFSNVIGLSLPLLRRWLKS